MGVNNDTLAWFGEQNKRNNIENYIRTFPALFAMRKVGAISSDPDYENGAFDFSGGPVEYEITAFEKSDLYIRQFHVFLEGGNTDFRIENYGNHIGAVTNGMVLAGFQDGEYQFVAPPLKSNADFQRFYNGSVYIPDWKLQSSLTSTLTLDVPVILRAGTTDRLVVQLFDDYSDLDCHFFSVSGWSTRVIE